MFRFCWHLFEFKVHGRCIYSVMVRTEIISEALFKKCSTIRCESRVNHFSVINWGLSSWIKDHLAFVVKDRLQFFPTIVTKQ